MTVTQPPQKKAFGQRLWEQLYAWLPTLTQQEQAKVYMNMRRSARANVDFYVLIILASIIAFFGLLQNSVAVIIGAMLVAPLMSPMIAIAHAIVMGNLRMLRRSVLSTLAGIGITIGSAALFTWLLPTLQPGSEILGRTHPSLLDLIVALASGAAAAYALGRKEVAAALPGVAIAAALVPPLCVVGYGLGSSNREIAYGASLLFLTNQASIILAGATMFLLLGFRPTRDEHSGLVRRGFVYATIGILVILIPLAISSISIVRQMYNESQTRVILTRELDANIAEVEEIDIRATGDGYVVAFKAYVYQTTGGEPDFLEDVRQQLASTFGKPVTLRVQVLPTTLVAIDENGLPIMHSVE